MNSTQMKIPTELSNEEYAYSSLMIFSSFDIFVLIRFSFYAYLLAKIILLCIFIMLLQELLVLIVLKSCLKSSFCIFVSKIDWFKYLYVVVNFC